MAYKKPEPGYEWKPGQSGNPNGRPKGSRSLSTIVRGILDDIDWSKTSLKDAKTLEQKYGKRGWEAVVYVATTKAISGDIRAMEFLRKSGFGDMVDITSLGEKIDPVVIYRPAKLDEEEDAKG